MSEQGRAAAMNLEAFAWGRWVAHDPDAVAAALGGGEVAETRHRQATLWDPSARSTSRARDLVRRAVVPAALHDLVERRAAQLLEYQGDRVARRWLDLVGRAAAADHDAHGFALTEAVAEGWFKLLTYKDEYEVARLHLRLDLDEIAGDLGIADGYRVQYHLHPPTLRRLGVDHKIALGGAWARAAFRGLAALRRVRGTPLDVFGYARHRREERQVAGEYAELMDAAISRLTPDTYAAAVDLARSVAAIRGYEDIKSASIQRWRADTAGLRAAVTGG
jgi:indolepyruvate ferredoxin oxidoreductase